MIEQMPLNIEQVKKTSAKAAAKKSGKSPKRPTSNVKRRAKKSSANPLTVVALNDELVSQYLLQNPNFFINNASKVEQMQIPHPIRGVVSLPEWQLARQRNKINQLESEITLLMEFASENEVLFNQLMALQKELMMADELDDLMQRLNHWAKSLGLIGAYLHLFDDRWQLTAPSSYIKYSLSTEKFEFIRIRHLQANQQYLGQLNTTEINLLIDDPTHFIGSVAISLLGRFGDLGVLIFASRNKYHYQAGQGTLLLEKISEILPILISRWIARK